MTIKIIDSINTLIQAFLFVYTINYSVESKYKKRVLELSGLIIFLFIVSELVTFLLGNLSICIFIIHIIELIILGIAYKKDLKVALSTFTLVYFSLGITLIILGNILFGYLQNIVPSMYINVLIILIIYLPQFILSFFIIKCSNLLLSITKNNFSRNFSIITMIILSFTMDFMVAFYFIIYHEHIKIFQNILLVTFITFIILNIVYFSRIQKKSNEIFLLNKALDTKVTELKKIKHDYGAQISYLYGLYLMERNEKLGESLKAIIDGHNTVAAAVEVNYGDETLISSILKSAVNSGIHVIIEELADLSNIEMSEIELYSVISNIVNNSIQAMNGRGIIIAKTYNSFNNIIIKLQNNGPKIHDDIIQKLFEPGFTTKNDPDNNHGYGLNIVKELVTNYNGSIIVSSSEKITEFQIELPLKA